jgi:hypothetical protein
MAPENPVKQYQIRLRLPHNILLEATGDDLNQLKETAQAVMKGGCRFEPFGSTNGVLIYHPNIDGGKTDFGMIGAWDVPEKWSNRALMGLHAQAA